MHISRFYRIYLPAVLTFFAALSSFASADSNTPPPAPVYGYEIVKTYPHDPRAFTQGLVFSKGFLYESTGLYGRSELRKLKLETAQVLLRHKLPRRFFAEGITIHRDRIIQLTWKSRKGFVYDSNTLEPLGAFAWPAQGWGITHDQERLIISDGTSTLHLLDPNTFEPIGSLKVHDNNTPVPRLNELEYVKGRIYANIWETDRIAVISPETGRVLAWIDLKGILKDSKHKKPGGVLNGITYDKKNDRLFVTGKLWPHIFHIRLIPPN
ncbi:MAG: glutaminyl-peptide cyclotransferase [Planctomycetota bacterium]|jgi:glutamine cyclotransferase